MRRLLGGMSRVPGVVLIGVTTAIGLGSLVLAVLQMWTPAWILGLAWQAGLFAALAVLVHRRAVRTERLSDALGNRLREIVDAIGSLRTQQADTASDLKADAERALRENAKRVEDLQRSLGRVHTELSTEIDRLAATGVELQRTVTDVESKLDVHATRMVVGMERVKTDVLGSRSRTTDDSPS